MADKYMQYTIDSFYDGDFFSYYVKVNDEGKIEDWVNALYSNPLWEPTFCPITGEKTDEFEERANDTPGVTIMSREASEAEFEEHLHKLEGYENIIHTELMYINPAMKNPKTGENIREAEMAKIEELKKQGVTIIGLEMTVPQLAELCDRNIDPQHTEGKADQSCAKEVAEKAPELLGWFKRQDVGKVVFVTNRVDVDSIGAYVLADRYLNGEKVSLNENVAAIDAHDTHLGAKWEGPKPIEQAFDPESKTGALAASIKVFMVTPKNIEDVKNFIDTGNVDETIMDSYRKSQQGIIDKVKSGDIKTEVVGGVAYVETTLPCATNVGYSFAPVVVATNPAMRNPDGTTYRKVSICQHEAGYVDLNAVADKLNEMEAGWGGSPTFKGSKQGENCNIRPSDIKKLVFANLTSEYKSQVTSHGVNASAGKDMGK